MTGVLAQDKLSRLIQDLVWVNLAIFIGNLSAYGYQFGLSRNLSVADYGLWNALLGITVLLQIPLWTINMVVTRRVAQLDAQGARRQMRRYLGQAFKVISRGMLVGFLLYVLFSPLLLAALDIASPVPLVVMAAAVATGLWLPLGLATLQGLQRFGPLSLAILVQRTSIFVGLGLVAVGAGVSGAVSGLLLGNVAGIVLSFWMSHLELSSEREGRPPDVAAADEGGEDQVWAVTLTYALVTGFLYLDLLFARYFLEPDTAGRYATVAILGKAIYYGPMGVWMLLVPKVASARAYARGTTAYLYLALLATILLIAPVVAVFSLFPQTVVSTLFGDKYSGEATADLMRLYVAASVLLTLAALVGQYYLARHSTRFVWAFVAGLVVTLLAILANHQSPNDLAIALIAGDSTTLAGMAVLEVASRPRAALVDYVRAGRTKTGLQREAPPGKIGK